MLTENHKIASALLVAARGHALQKRKSTGEPYINHLIEVFYILINIAEVDDVDILCASILHDVLEDTNVTAEQIQVQFGDSVASMVVSLSEDKTLTLEQRRVNTLCKLRQSSKSIRQIKLADISSNAAAVPNGWSKQKLKEYFKYLSEVAEICRPENQCLYEYFTDNLKCSSDLI